MTRRYAFFGLAVALLGILNLWQWQPLGSGKEEPQATVRADFRVEDFQLKMAPITIQPDGRARDLFHAPLPVPPAAIKKVETPPPPPKTTEQLAEEAARAELAQIKLVGVVFRGDRGEAFLVVRDQLHMVRAGEKIGGRFHVEAIRQDSIQVKDPVTQVSGQIPISGK